VVVAVTAVRVNRCPKTEGIRKNTLPKQAKRPTPGRIRNKTDSLRNIHLQRPAEKRGNKVVDNRAAEVRSR